MSDIDAVHLEKNTRTMNLTYEERAITGNRFYPYDGRTTILKMLKLVDELSYHHMVAVTQRLQFEHRFPLYYSFERLAYVRSPTLEDNLEVLENYEFIVVSGRDDHECNKFWNSSSKLTTKGKEFVEKIPYEEGELSRLEKELDPIKKMTVEEAKAKADTDYVQYRELR